MQHLIGEEKERTLVRAVLSLFLLVTKRLYGKEWEWSIGQIKTCRKKQHVEIDDRKEMPDLFCGKAAVGGNYNLMRDNNKKEEETAKKENREPLLLPHFSCHHLRHTFCTRLCENESNLKVIQSVMGHSDIQTTMDIYAECTAEKKQEVFATLNGKIMIK